MTEQTLVPKDHPMMIAWNAYQGSPEYDNSFKWAAMHEHRDGSMWAAFCAGWNAAHQPAAPEKVDAKIAKALAEAVTILYLDDSADYGPALWTIVKILGGQEAADLLESDELAAYEKYKQDSPQ